MKTSHTIYTSFAKRVAIIFTLLTLGVISVWAETSTFTWGTNPSAYTSGSSNFSEGQVTFTGTKGTGSTPTRAWSDGLRIYAGGTAQFSVPDGYVITKIEGYTTFNFNDATGQQTVLFTGLSKATCSTDVTVTYQSSGYTITYNTNGGTAVSSTTGTKLPNPLPTTTKTGYTFAGWYTNSALTAAATAGATIDDDITLYAKWTANKYTVKFNGNGNTSGSMTDQSFTYDIAQDLTANAFEKFGHTFAGWSKTSNGSVVYTDGQSVSNLTSTNNGTVTLYAKWTEKSLVRYRTSCECIPPTVTIKPITEFGWRYSIGETIGLNAIVEGAYGDCTYQWQKYVVDQWQDIAGATNETFTKENCDTGDGGSYRCVVNAGNDCIAESEPYYVRVFTLNGYYYSEEIAANKIEWTGENTGVATIHLGQSRTYLFKVTDNEGKWFGYGDYEHFNYIVQPWQADCGIETGNGTNTDIRLFTGPEGDYTFTINIEHALDNEPYVNIAVAYPEVEHPVAGYGYITKWWNECYIHWWDNNNDALTAWGSDAQINTYTTICETEYYFFPIIDNYINLIIKDNAGDPINTTEDQTQTGHSGWYITHDGNSWGWHEFATYTITFDANGGNGTMDALSGICPTTDKTLTTNAFTKSGYTFVGWKANKNVTINGVSVVAGTLITDCATIQNITSNITLTAQWTPKNITITWDANGGSVTPPTSPYTYNGAVVELPIPTRANYIFNGWFTAATGGTKITEVGTNNKPTEDVTYYAQWTEKATPTFAWSAATCTAALEADNTFPTLNNPNTLPVTYTSSNTDVATIDANGNITLVATGPTTITADGAETATHKSATTTYELTVVESNCRWVETEIEDISPEDEVLVTMGDDKIVYALGTEKIVNSPKAKKFNVIGNYLEDSNYSNYSGYSWYIIKTNDGYQLQSYTDNSKFLYGVSSYITISDSPTTFSIFKSTENGNECFSYIASSVYYLMYGVENSQPAWKRGTTTNHLTSQTLKFYKRECLDSEHYWVTWDANEGTWTDGSSNKLESYQVGATISEPTDPTREGYRFDGWTPTPETMPAQNTTFTAKWTKVYTITWYENGVPSYTEVPSDNPVVTWEDNIADCGTKKFYGWTADDTFVSDPTTPPSLISKGTTIAGDVTYYAVYADAVKPANLGYTKVTTISEGTYLIAAPSKNIAYKAVTSNVSAVISNNVISSLPEGATELLVELGTNTNAGYFAISYNNNGAKTYIYAADKSLNTTNTATYDWSLDADNATLGEIQSKSKSGYYIQANNNNGDFKAYAHTQTVAYLYKKQTTTYKNFAVSCATYDISVTTPTGGTVTTTPADEAGAGQTITVNVTPDDCKYLTALKYNKYNDGSDYSINISSTPYTFTMPAADVSVTATFADKTATDIEILTSAHRNLMQGSAFVGEQVRITYNNGDKETLNWNDSRLTFTGYNTATLGSQTVTVTYNDCGTQSASYNIEVIDGLGITFWDGNYTEVVKYEPGDLVDVDSRIGQNICSGWEFVGWSETKVANESNGFTPVHNFNATDAKVLYAVYVETSTDWISAYNIDELHSGAKYVIVAHYSDSKEYALTNTNNTNPSYLDGVNLSTDCEKVQEGDAYPYKYRYKLKVTPDENWKWQLENTGSGWTMRNISANKYLKINTDKSISLTTTPDDKFTLSDGSNDSEITAQSSSNNYLSWYNSYKYWNGHTSGQQYYLTNETNFTSTPPCSRLSATFHGNGGIVTDGERSLEDLPITEPTRDAGITTPTASFADCNGKSWTFVGWSRKEIDVTRVPVLTTDLLHDGGGNKHYYIQEDGEEFWAVYTNQGTPETKYGTITFTDADVTKQYENAKTITKSVTAMGDYDFELYHVSDASSLGIQFDHNSTPKGYIKNITSLGKINSISLNDFQEGDIDDVKVYVGNTSDAINILLTEADLQQTGNTYTYYPPKNYAYVKIEANGYCGITSISIDFGKGTQIWATTPDCSVLTLSGDEVYVTSTNGQSIRATAQLTVRARQLPTNLVLTSNNSDVYFSTEKDANFTKAVAKQPKQLLTLDVDGDGNLDNTTIYVHYKPSSEGNGISEEVVVSANLETPNPAISDEQTIHVRNLPTNFVIAAKWGDNWYAMPANMDSQSSTEGWLIEVDDAANPTKAIAAPNTTKYGLKSVYTSNSSDDRFADNGERLVFVENVTEITPVANQTLYNGGGSGTSNTNIQVYAQYSGYYSNNPDRYEWIPTTTNMQDYTLTSAHQFTKDDATLENARTVSLDNHGIFGTLLQDKSYNGMVRLLPVDNFYEPIELQVVEWKQKSVSVMYTGAGTKYTTKVGKDEESSVQELSSIDHAVYSLSTADLTSATNQPLIITIKDGATTVGAIKLTIPAIVATTNATTKSLVTSNNIAKATSIVVLDGATLTADDTKYTYDDITVYPGGKLVIGQSGQLGMYSLTLRAGSSWGAADYEHKYPQFVLNNSATGAYSNSSGQINLDYVTTKEQYYTFVAPFDVNTKDIKYPVDIYGSNVAKANSGSFEFQYYDGEARAAGSPGWKVVEEDPTNGATLEAGQGYTFLGMPKKIDGNRQKYGIHRIPMKVAAGTAQSHETADQTVPLSVHLSAKNNNSGWNLVGNPYMSKVANLSNNDIQVGKLVHTNDANDNWTGGWHWDDPTTGQRFLVIPSNDGKSYEAVQASNATLPAFKNFFVQISNESANAMSIPVENRVERNLAPARYAEARPERDVEVAIVLEQDEAHSDQLDFLLNDTYSAAFDFNGDFTKMMNATNLNIYGVHTDDNLSFIAIDQHTAQQSIPIGYQVPAAGEYTLRISDKPYVMWNEIDALYVTDHEMSPEVTVDLLHAPYEFSVNQAETNNERFTVSVRVKAKTENGATGLGNVGADGEQIHKFIYQDKMYILHHGVIYDATGKRVITINK